MSSSSPSPQPPDHDEPPASPVVPSEDVPAAVVPPETPPLETPPPETPPPDAQPETPALEDAGSSDPSPTGPTSAGLGTPRLAPAPLPYHCAVRDHFRDRDPELWKWFRDRQTPEALRENVRLELLKSAFRLEPSDRPELYAAAGNVAELLELSEVPITLYQAQSGEGMNAGLYFVPGEIHVVLQGPVLQRLSPAELEALLAHELSHHSFLVAQDGEFQSTLSVIDTLTQGADAEFAHVVTARHFDLFTEILCDRGSLHVSGDPLVAIAAMVKVATGLESVSAESYLRQAQEIHAKGRILTEGGTHPESYVRALALTMFAEKGEAAEPEIAAMIVGDSKLDSLDLPGQVRVSNLTRRLIQAFLSSPELQAEGHLAQAHLYFDDFQLAPEAVEGGAESSLETLFDELQCDDPAMRDYFCYVLIDFIAVDREVTDEALIRGLCMFSTAGLGRAGWDARLAELGAKELGLRKKEIEKIRKRAAELGAPR